jgi:putative hydrolase of the HAD superfamily
MPDKPNIQNVIFDLGGVVVDWNPDAVVRVVLDDPVLQDRVKQTIFQHPDWLEIDRGTLTEAEAIPAFAQRAGIDSALVVELLRTADRMLIPKPDTLDLIQELHDKNLSLYVLSNIPSGRFAYLKERHDFWDVFQGAVISGDLGTVKPEKAIYEYLFHTYQLDPSTCVFIDDSSINIDGARAVGMDGIVFTDAASCRSVLEEML